MNRLILEDGSSHRWHRQRLDELLSCTDGPVWIASAYVTDRVLLRGIRNRETRLLISLLPMDVASGATSLEAIGWMIRSGIECRVLPDRPRLHAKTYIFGSTKAVVTSANLTSNALESNLEVGVEVEGELVTHLRKWFDRLWQFAQPLTESQLLNLQSKTASLRREYMKLTKSSASRFAEVVTPPMNELLTDSLKHLFTSANHFFICNSDRRQGARTTTGGFALEEGMHNRGLAAAWESFKFPSHMQEVEPGDAVFMFAKGVGIIGIGVATAPHEILLPHDPDRLRNFENEQNTIEWRVPVKWLQWTDEAGAYPYKSPNFTFWNITGAEYDDLRQAVRSHFLRNSE